MELENDHPQKNQMRGKVRALRANPPGEEPAEANAKRERFLALLKRRYGYTNDQAVDELERLLVQFARTNNSLNPHRPHSIVQPPHAE